MRKYWVLVASAASLVSTPALARDGAWYIGGEVGAVVANDTDVDIGATEDAVTLNHSTGYDAALFAGHDFGSFRLEAEAAHKRASLGGFETLVRLPGEGPVFPPSRDSAQGSTNVLSFMVNGMVDFGDDDGVSAFAGGGLGLARVKYNNLAVFANSAPFLDDDDWGFAWQLVAGARLPVGDTVDLTARYRFFNTTGIRMVAFNGNEADSRFSSHSFLVGITFNFGGPGQ